MLSKIPNYLNYDCFIKKKKKKKKRKEYNKYNFNTLIHITFVVKTWFNTVQQVFMIRLVYTYKRCQTVK